MRQKSRTANSVRNSAFRVGSYTISFFLSAVVRVFFIRSLGNEYLGLNGLFSNIIGMLSLAELGIGAAIIYKFYKPIAEVDRKKITQLMRFYKNAYMCIAFVVAVVGLTVMPFINHIIADTPDISESLYVVYLMFLLNSVASYFLIYRQKLIIANQQEYIVSIVFFVYHVVLAALQLAVLFYFQSFYLFLGVQIVSTITQNIVISLICKKKYPFITEPAEPLPKPERKGILKDVRAIILYRVSDRVLHGTDSVIISAFVGLVAVGLYSNYLLVLSAASTLLAQAMRSFTASIGNLNTTDDTGKQELVYKTVNMMAFWAFGAVGSCLYVLLSPLITLWLGPEFILDGPVLTIIIVNFYFMGITISYDIFRETFGLFVQGRLRPVLTAVINLFMSLLLVQYMGMIGVFLGTLAAYITVHIWFDPRVVYTHIFKKSAVSFVIRNIFYFLAFIVSAFASAIVCGAFSLPNAIADFLCKAVICFFIVNGIFFILFHRTNEFKYAFKSASNVLKRFKQKERESLYQPKR
jgi:O-antigen/teichoic acid export membrane protein